MSTRQSARPGRRDRTAPRTASGFARRAHSRRTKWLTALAFAVVVLVVFAGIGIRAHMATTPQALVDEAVEYISRADVNIVQMDDVLNSKVTTQTMSEIANVRPGVEVALDALESAQSLLERAKDKDPSSIAEIRLLERAVDARLDMLALAPPLVNLTGNAGESLVRGLEGYQMLTQATNRAVQAKAAFNPASPEAIASTKEISAQAIAAFREAEDKLGEASTLLPDADYTAYFEYVNLRIQMLQALESAANHASRGDAAAANGEIRRLNELDGQAAAVASSRLTAVESIVENGYRAAAGTISTDYSAAKAKVLEVDKLVR